MVILNALVVWLHLVAAVVWVGGGLINMLVLMPSLTAIDPPPMRGKFMQAVLARMGPVVWVAIVVLAVTGIYQLLARVSSFGMLFSTAYGITMLIKIVIAVVMIAIAAYMGFVLTPKMPRPATAAMAGGSAGRPPSGPLPPAAKIQAQMVAMGKTNIILGLVVLAAVAVMRSV